LIDISILTRGAVDLYAFLEWAYVLIERKKIMGKGQRKTRKKTFLVK